jgi:hypothetical protein
MDRHYEVTPEGGNHPRWHPGGESLFFLSVDNNDLMEAEIRTDPRFEIGPVERISRGPYEAFDVTSDGERFLAVKLQRGEPITELVVVENWFEELKRKAPPGRVEK